MRQAA